MCWSAFSAFILLCIDIQIIWRGYSALSGIPINKRVSRQIPRRR
jgi:hypothetical protein